MLLFCQNYNCNIFNYSNSILLSTFGAQEVRINYKHYYPGNYTAFAFDTNVNGSIRPTELNVAYSIPPKVVQLTMGSLSGIFFLKILITHQYIHYSFDTGEYHESVGLVFTRVPQARA